jgi:uncharacterized protein
MEHEHEHEHPEAHEHDHSAHEHDHSAHEHEHSADEHVHSAHEHHAATYEEAIAGFRADKDEYFRESPETPLLPEDRPKFTGIAYFSPDARYRLENIRLAPPATDEEKTFPIPTSDGQVRTARRIGQLPFELDGRRLSLHAYGLPGMHGGSLFVPFLDATSGHETYEAGRYLDLEPDEEGSYTLDFNLAYHPTCVFSPYYSCPLTPQENRLPIRIEAGEQLTPGIGGH